MAEFLIDFLGINRDSIPEDAIVRMELAGLPQGENLLFLLLFGLLLMGLTGWFYRREGAAPNWQKGILAFLRVLVIASTLLVFCQPRLSAEREETVGSATIVLLDHSMSMSVKDRIDRAQLRADLAEISGFKEYDIEKHTRAEILEKILDNKDVDLIKRLGKNNEVFVFKFGQETQVLNTDKGPLKIKPNGQYTDLSTGIRNALSSSSLAGKNVAGVIVFSDGRANAGEDPGAIASFLKERAIPIYTIGIGNPDPPKDIRVTELLANPRVYKDDQDTVIFAGQMEATGYAGQTVEAVLLRKKVGEEEFKEVAKQDIEIKDDEFIKKFNFEVDKKVAGTFKYTLWVGKRSGLGKIQALKDESNSKNNYKPRDLTVIEDDTRVLMICGAPNNEYRFLRNLLYREKRLQLSCWLQTADPDFPQDGNKRITELPRTQEQLFKYDVIILIDPREDLLDPAWATLLEKFVGKHGGGLCFIAGDKNTTDFFDKSTMKAIHDVLPVKAQVREAESLIGGGSRFTDRWAMKLTSEGENHPITRLSSNPEILKQFWGQLPGFYWHYPFRPKQAARVLLESMDPTRVRQGKRSPLLAAHYYGPGRTVFSSFDSSWRWRNTAISAYQRYWIQLMRYLVEGRLLGGQKRMIVKTDEDEYQLGDVVTVRVKLLKEDFEPMTGASLSGLAKSQDGKSQTEVIFKEKMDKDEDGDDVGTGVYLGEFTPEQPDLYDISVEAAALIGEGSRVSTTVQVNLPDIEFADTTLNTSLLKGIGKYVELPDLKDLPPKIPSRVQKTPGKGWVFDLWDNGWVLTWLVLLLGFEWYFRKRCRMV